MGRTIIRDVLIFTIIGVMLFTGMITFVTNLGVEYNVNLPSEYSVFADNVTNSTTTLYQITKEMQNETEASEGITESSAGDEFSLSKSLIRAAKLIFEIPKIFNTFITQVSSIFGIPAWFSTGLMSILIVIVVMAIISLIARKDS